MNRAENFDWCSWSTWSHPSATCGFGTSTRARILCCQGQRHYPLHTRCADNRAPTQSESRADHVGIPCQSHAFGWTERVWILIFGGLLALIIFGLIVCKTLVKKDPTSTPTTHRFQYHSGRLQSASLEMNVRIGAMRDTRLQTVIHNEDMIPFLSASDMPPAYDDVVKECCRPNHQQMSQL